MEALRLLIMFLVGRGGRRFVASDRTGSVDTWTVVLIALACVAPFVVVFSMMLAGV